jgi:hypothetical protein
MIIRKASEAALLTVQNAAGQWSAVVSLPPAAVHDLLEWPPIRPLDRGQRPVGRVAQRDQERAGLVLRKAEQPPRELLIADGRVAAPDAQAGGREHDAHRRLAEVERGAALLVRCWRYQRDGRRGLRHVAGALPSAGAPVSPAISFCSLILTPRSQESAAVASPRHLFALAQVSDGRSRGGRADMGAILRRHDRPAEFSL